MVKKETEKSAKKEDKESAPLDKSTAQTEDQDVKPDSNSEKQEPDT